MSATSIANQLPTSLLVLHSLTARDLMQPNPLCISQHTKVVEAGAILMGHSYSAAPVVNERGHAIGVVSLKDLVRCHCKGHPQALSNAWMVLECEDETEVSEIMTPTVVTVTPDTSARLAIGLMLAKKVHRLFVVDETGTLIGVISTLDILQKLAP